MHVSLLKVVFFLLYCLVFRVRGIHVAFGKDGILWKTPKSKNPKNIVLDIGVQLVYISICLSVKCGAIVCVIVEY